MKVQNSIFDFAEIPRVGTRHSYFAGVVLTLVEVEPYPRKDGSQSAVLVWKADDGRVGTSGLRGKGINWRAPL